jgi:transcriptional regulator with XRE-family HTH domain
MTDPKATFAELVRFYRKKRRFTQEELAVKASIATSYITLLETGKRTQPGWKTVTGLANALGIKGKERRAFLKSAGYTEDIVGKTKIDLTPPIFQKLADFLNTSPQDPTNWEKLRDFQSEFSGEAAEKGILKDRNQTQKINDLLTIGYCSTPKNVGPKKGSKKAHDALLIKLSNQVRELVEIFVDGSLPIKKRIGLAEEMLSFLKWKLRER